MQSVLCICVGVLKTPSQTNEVQLGCDCTVLDAPCFSQKYEAKVYKLISKHTYTHTCTIRLYTTLRVIRGNFRKELIRCTARLGNRGIYVRDYAARFFIRQTGKSSQGYMCKRYIPSYYTVR